MLILIHKLSEDSIDAALNTAAIGLAFNRVVEVVFLETDREENKGLVKKIHAVKEMGLERIFEVAPVASEPAKDLGVTMVTIDGSELRRLCGFHTAILSF